MKSRHHFGKLLGGILASILVLGTTGLAHATSYTAAGSYIYDAINAGYYEIGAGGAQGGMGSNCPLCGSGNGGLGASVGGLFYLSGNQFLNLLVGGQGVSGDYGISGGGGGGSFVYDHTSSTLLEAAGGGGGGGYNTIYSNVNGGNGYASKASSLGASGSGTGGSAIQNGSNGAGGGGYTGNGTTVTGYTNQGGINGSYTFSAGGASYVNGGAGGSTGQDYGPAGGFGGGGQGDTYGGGGGGGFNGGYGGSDAGGSLAGGGGGGGSSFMSAVVLSATYSTGSNSGNGFIDIVYAGAVNPLGSGTPSATPEPSTLALFGTGALLLGGMALRRKSLAIRV